MSVGGGLALLNLVVLGLSPAAPAKPIAVSIELDAPPACADVARFYARLRARTDRVRGAEPGEPAIKLRVRLTPSGNKVHGELSFMDESAPRSVDGSSCDEVVEALSLTAALALDPSALMQVPTASDDSEGGDASRTQAAGAADATKRNGEAERGGREQSKRSEAEAASTREPRGPANRQSDEELVDALELPAEALTAKTSLGFEIGGQLELATVVSPRMNLGGAAFVRLLRRTPYGARSALGLAVSHTSDHLFGSTRKLAIALTQLTLSACPLAIGSSQAVRVEPCVLLSGGLLSASSRGVSNPDNVRRSFWTAGGLLRAAVPLTERVSLELTAGFYIPLVQRQFKLSAPDQFLGQTETIAGFGSFGFAYGF